MSPIEKSVQLTPAQTIEILLDRIRSFAPAHDPRRTSEYVGFERDGSPDNFVVLRERAYGLRADVKLEPDAACIVALKAAGVEVLDHRPYGGGPGIHPVRITGEDVIDHFSLLSHVFEMAYRRHSSCSERATDGPSSSDRSRLERVASAASNLGTNFESALSFTIELHGDQVRKGGEEVPYLGHLLGVCSLVIEAGGDAEQAIAALLHDAAEDQGGRDTLELIRRRFGDRVADIVDACTDTFEDPKPPWRQRKTAYLDEVGSKPADALLVICADKLYNARSIVRDYRRMGNEVFERFTPAAEDMLWYYRSLADALRRSGLESWLVDELERTVGEMEEAVEAG